MRFESITVVQKDSSKYLIAQCSRVSHYHQILYFLVRKHAIMKWLVTKVRKGIILAEQTATLVHYSFIVDTSKVSVFDSIALLVLKN